MMDAGGKMKNAAGEPASSFILPPSSLSQAVSGLRRAGRQDHLPRGLLTRAWLRHLSGARSYAQAGPDSAQSDLDEAWDIATRGGMRLFQADIHLYRARLFGGMRDEGGGMKEGMRDEGGGMKVAYPWESVEADLAAAETLINKCGYERRKEELEDAKRALLGTQ